MISDIELQKKVDVLTNKLKSGLFNEVIGETKILLKKRKHQVLFNLLSLSYQSLREYDKSIEIMETALRANSKNPHFLNNIGLSHFNLHNFEKAENYFKRGLNEAPNYIGILNNLGNLKNFLNFNYEAIPYFKKILSLNNKLIEPHYNLAIIYEQLGKFDESLEHLKEILDLNPKFTFADRLISNMTKYTENDPHFKSVKNKLENLNLDDIQKSQLYFVLGKYFEDIKNYNESFINYSKGNSIMKIKTNYKIDKDKKEFNDIKNYNFDNLNIINSGKSRKLIFIVGMPRSGTSLVEQILSSHSKVVGGGELPFLEKIIKKNFLNSQKESDLSVEKVKNLILNCQNQYLEKISNFDNSEKIFTDKTPLNFRFIGFIKYLFPNAKVIHCKRDSLDTAWSNFKNYFSNSMPFTNDLEDIGNFHKIYEDLMNFWKKSNDDFIYDIEYSSLVQNPKSEISKLLDFCELEWDQDCLNHHKNDRAIKTASSSQARKPIYKTAIKSSDNYAIHLQKLKSIISVN